MGTLHNLFYWGTGSFSGTGQFDEGPFAIGAINKLLRAEVRGELNFQGDTFGDTSVSANLLMWGLQIVPHGDAAQDVIVSDDNDSWLLRRQTGGYDYPKVFSPSTDTAAALTSIGMREDWAGQLAEGISVDAYLSFAPPFGGSTPNFNTYGTLRFWYA
jgi:hypothetical protein